MNENGSRVKWNSQLTQNIFRITANFLDCVEDRYGENCILECPPCENGGICDDKNGTCICPPGFMGEWCEIGG